MDTFKYALITLYDKTNIVELAQHLCDTGYHIISTGGTFKHLQQHVSNPSRVIPLNQVTDYPEILNGRVKTLHPKIHGGILSLRTNSIEESNLNLPNIEIVVVNLYPFHQVDSETSEEDALELIDIGGHTLIRASAKNYPFVTILTDPSDYTKFIQGLYSDKESRKKLASKALLHATQYDMMITNYFDPSLEFHSLQKSSTPLKYGCNPHQLASLYTSVGNELPFRVLNGELGYINVLDALYGWQLVYEMRQQSSKVAAASMKHNSPAGAAYTRYFLDPLLKQLYGVEHHELSPLAIAYLLSRDCDPKSSFGDFIAVNEKVDKCTALLIKRDISDGIVAPSYDPEALEILKKKKNGKFIILEADPIHSCCEFREVGRVILRQDTNNTRIESEDLNEQNIVTTERTMTLSQKCDLLLANLCLKYATSNTIALVKNGTLMGLAAGQQSRIDCTQLACRKALVKSLRTHENVLNRIYPEGVTRQEVINGNIKYIEENLLHKVNPRDYLKDLCLASDAFFPFRDNIDKAYEYGVKYVIQPGGSVADSTVVNACDEHAMVMVLTGKRMFTH